MEAVPALSRNPLSTMQGGPQQCSHFKVVMGLSESCWSAALPLPPPPFSRAGGERVLEVFDVKLKEAIYKLPFDKILTLKNVSAGLFCAAWHGLYHSAQRRPAPCCACTHL